MQAKLSMIRIESSSTALRNSRTRAIADSVSGGKAASVILTCGKACPEGVSSRKVTASRSLAPSDSSSCFETPLAASAIAAPVRTPTGMISTPVRPHSSGSGNEGGRSYAGERIEDGHGSEVLKQVFDQPSGEALFVLHPAQAGNFPVPLI